MDKIIVTSALPYANGPLHIGHIAGAYLPADIYVRFQKLLGADIIFVSGTDEHGAPISIKAESEGITPKEIVDRYHKNISESFKGLEIDFDNFSGTARPEHHEISQRFFLNLLKRGFVSKKEGKQWYDPKHNRFLADRYVEGICPFCGSPGARGDQCDSCGKLIDSLNLIEPRSKISGEIPILKETAHWYLELPKFTDELKNWLSTKKNWKDNVINFIMGWLKDGLKERAITRDIDWGVPVPLKEAEGKVLYVWFDAPIGYISSTIEWAKKIGDPERWKKYWLDPKTRLIHFLGKDNIPFHTIIWPAMLMEQELDYVLPDDVPANEYLNLEGQKMSTSRNWTVWVEDFLKNFSGEYLRYYLAANAPESKDSDFYWKEFQNQINNDLANVLGNLANRVFLFAKKYFDGRIDKESDFSDQTAEIIQRIGNDIIPITEAYQTYQVRKAIGLIIDIARFGNKYFDETKPWVTVKTDVIKAKETLYNCMNLLRIISITLFPVIPGSMRRLRKMMNLNVEFSLKDISVTEDYFQIGETEPLFSKVEDNLIENEIVKLKSASIDQSGLEHKAEISYDDFSKMEFRVVKILKADKIPKSGKLLKLTVDLGGEIRTVVAGIAKSYSPESMIGKQVAMLINLQPRNVMGIESQAMILAAHHGESLSVLVPDNEVPAGSEIS
ncbi:MAG: methionine--tRNA ligase [Candidatus Cloacimonetes bacterium]|nr:methionine--tRNA ligase [Candidatus Cloacimonadota bacterium]